jgi:hypothetical protein
MDEQYLAAQERRTRSIYPYVAAALSMAALALIVVVTSLLWRFNPNLPVLPSARYGVGAYPHREVEELLGNGEYDKAETILRGHLSRLAYDEYALHQLMRLCFYTEKYEECLECYEKLHSRRPDWEVVYMDKSMVDFARAAVEKERPEVHAESDR